jgi:hypothetical protein
MLEMRGTTARRYLPPCNIYLLERRSEKRKGYQEPRDIDTDDGRRQ